MTTSTQPGWYDDPEDANGQRYWDGQAWTPHRQQKPASQPSSAPNFPPPQPAWQAPGYPPAGPPPQRSSNPAVLIGVILGVIVLGVGGFFGVKHFAKKPASPEDQIRTVIQRETDNANKGDFSYSSELECKALSDHDKSQDKQLSDLRTQTGTWSATVANIQVTGDSATADVTIKFEKLPDKPQTESAKFVKEDGKWKDCTPPDSSNSDSNGDQGG